MFAPMITPSDCWSVMMPAVMKPITSTVVTEDEFRIAVTTAAVIAPMKRLRVNRPKTSDMRVPATAFSPPDS